MYHFKLKRAVGKSTFPDQNDVMETQYVLSQLKNRCFKPYYRGKIDGKQSQVLIDSICSFQKENKLSMTEKVDPHCATFRCMKQRSMNLKPRKSPASTEQNTTSPFIDTDEINLTHLKNWVRVNSRKVYERAQLPDLERRSMADLISKMGQAGICLDLTGTNITQDGCFSAQLYWEDAAHYDAKTYKTVTDTISRIFTQSGQWRREQPNNLSFVSRTVHPVLKNYKLPTDQLLKQANFNKNTLPSPVEQVFMFVHVENCYGKDKGTYKATQNSKQLAKISQQTPTTTNQPETKKLRKEIEMPPTSSRTQSQYVMEDIAKWVHEQMINNHNSVKGRELVQLLHDNKVDNVIQEAIKSSDISLAQKKKIMNLPYGDLLQSIDYIKAVYIWIMQVNTGKPWDFKSFKFQAEEGLRGTYLLTSNGKRRESHVYDPITDYFIQQDIWGNIHYGFIGRSVGFTESTLLSGAGGAQLLSDLFNLRFNNLGKGISRLFENMEGVVNFDPPEDRFTVQFGIDLFNKYGRNITLNTFISEIRSNISKFPVKR